MKVSNLSNSTHKIFVLFFSVVIVLSSQVPYFSYSSTNASNLDNVSIQISQELDSITSNNTTASAVATNKTLNLDEMSNSTGNATITLTPNNTIVNLELPESIVDLLGSAPPLADQQNITENLTNTNDTMVLTTNETQLTGTENVTILANFTSKPFGLETDYSISEKPVIVIDGTPLNYEYLNDPTDEITISDILISMRASIKLDNSSNALPVQLRVFANPTNVTENADGSRTFINDPTNLENLEIAGTIFSEAKTVATVHPNGSGTLNATNIE
jgi:hypothetical protein